jgi:cytoskeletal protein CcmA (bactofilin family)
MLPSFKKTEAEPFRVAQPAPPQVPQATAPLGAPIQSPLRANNSMSIIGADLIVTGNLISKGQVQVDGEIQGDVHASLVSVGETARVTGSIVGEEVVVRGHVLGSVRGRRVLLQNSSHVEGDVYHQTLAIEQGAYFEGKSRRAEDPTAGMMRSRDDLPAPVAPPAPPAPQASPMMAPPIASIQQFTQD